MHEENEAQRMKIGIICYPTYGGSGVLATELGLALALKNHEVHFITYRRPVRLSQFNKGVYFHEVLPETYPLFEYTPYETALASKIVDVCMYENLDVLHVHYAVPHATAAFLAQQVLETRGKNIPFITTLHGTDITLVGTNSAYAPVIEFSINRSTIVTAVSDSLRQQTYDYFSINKKIEVVYNFVDFNRFKPTEKPHFKTAIAPNGEKLLVHVSNFRKVKRVQDVIKVFHKVQEKIPSKLLLIGDGPERTAMEQLCRSLGICNEILFLGRQQAIEEVLGVADLFILTSEKESFGLAALESMACEVPVISSNAGGIPEVNIHNQTGFVSEVGDIDDMARNAITLLTDDGLYQTFKQNALQKARAFSLDVILPQYESIYQNAVQDILVQ